MSKQNKKNGKFISKAFIVFAVLVAFFALLGFNEETNETSNANYISVSSSETEKNDATSVFDTSTTISSTKESIYNATSNNDLTKSNFVALKNIPNYSGSPYVVVNNNNPFFTESEKKINNCFEEYSSLDGYGRCGTAFACIGFETMPTQDRGSIGQVKPSGWHTIKYDCVDGKYLYNRCHLIGYQLTAENANEKNLITGTRYLNIDGMLPFENMVADYVKETSNHVLYRVTPLFDGNNLLANGVLMEAWSLEDKGAGICFNVFCYNVQPGININYSNGDSSLKENSETNKAQTTTKKYITENETTTRVIKESNSKTVYRTPTGKRYHYISTCGGKNSYEVSLDDAKAAGLTPCQKCAN